MNSNSLPLFADYAGRAVFIAKNKKYNSQQIIADACCLAEKLPAKGYILNLHQDRRLFTTGFLAALIKGLVSLFPSSTNKEVLSTLIKQYPTTYLLNIENPLGNELPWIKQTETNTHNGYDSPPCVAANQLAAIVFTSGSTGQPKAHEKYWGDLVQVAKLTGKRLISENRQLTALVATVPSQHMYGLEASCMFPLQNAMTIQASMPFFPADVAESIAQMEQNTLLVTTPLHLKAFKETKLSLAGVPAILSATSPLALPLAKHFEEKGTAVFEIYGCTEIGTIALRQSAIDTHWRTLADIQLESQPNIETESAKILTHRNIQEHHIPDIITAKDKCNFKLHRRVNDMVNIAGKRASIEGLNATATSIIGVKDAAFYQPDANTDKINRLKLAVVSSLTETELREALCEKIENCFMPRKMIFVDTLPRNTLGKLPRSALEQLFQG